MRKLLFANLGAAAALGVGAMGVTIAITHKVKSDKAQARTVENINNVFKQIDTLYGSDASIKEITESNYNSLYTYIQQSIAGTIASISTSTNKALALQKDDLLVEIGKVSDALKAHSSFDDSAFASIYSAISQQNSKLESISSLQASFEEKINTLSLNYQNTAKDLWDAIDSLITKTSTIQGNVTANYNELSNLITGVQNRLLDVDQLKNMILSTQTTVQNVVERVNALEASLNTLADKTGYDLQTLQGKLGELTTAQNSLATDITTIEDKISDIWTHINKIYDLFSALQNKVDVNETDIATIVAELNAVKQIQGNTSAAQATLLTAFNTINDKIDGLFIGNTQLQTQIDYLNSQNNILFENFLYLQSLIHEMESTYGTGSSTTVSIKPDEKDSKFVIYDTTNNQQITNFPSINVTNLSRAKRFAIYIKVWSGTTLSYETQIIDAYPNYDLRMIGSSTQGFSNEQFLVSVGLDRNVDKININGVWSRKSSDSWKPLKNVDNMKVQITNVVVTY